MENILSNSLNLSVTTFGHKGLRNYMEDNYSIAFHRSLENNELSYVYFAIFDGHGGETASLFAKNHLLNFIIEQEEFWSINDDDVKESIRKGFLACHHAMWKNLDKWPKTHSGLPSTSGTTASVAFIKNNKLFIGHCGDSGIILGKKDEKNPNKWKCEELTVEHKPEAPDELKRIVSCGGKVQPKQGIHRVVWFRNKNLYQGPARRSTKIEEVPFLAVARSLGDLWSYNYSTQKFVVSPEPDVTVTDIDVKRFKCLLLASDGLWNVMDSTAVIDFVCQTNRSNEQNASNSFQPWINTSQSLVEEALDRWDSKDLRADNVSVVCVMFNTLQEEQQHSKISSTMHQMNSIEVGQHILLDHCYEETFKLKMLESLACGFNGQVINRDTHGSLHPTNSQYMSSNQYVGEEDEKSTLFDNCVDNFCNDNSVGRSILSQELEKVSVLPACSNNMMMVGASETLESKENSEMEEFYSQLKMPKINNKENSKVMKKIRAISSNKFYETRQKDRKMRSGHVFSSAISETTRRRSAKLQLPVINENNYQENSKGSHKKVNNRECSNSSTIEDNVKALRSSSSYFLKDKKEIDSPSGDSKYLKLNNIFLSRKRSKLFGTKSTKRPYSEKVTKKNSVSQSKH